MTEEFEFDDTGLDRWTDDERFDVTQDRLAEYAAATNDPIEAHRRGDIAPPVFAIVPVFEALLTPAVDVMPVEAIPRIVHGEQDFHFHRPIRPGDKLVSRGKMIGELSPGHKFDDKLREQAPVAKVVQHIDTDQTFRYSPAAGDPMPIHLDEDVARDAGLPGIIAHGLCTMAFTSWAVLTELAGSDVNRLKRFAVRFSKPVLPDDALETRIWSVGSANGTTSYAFETARGGDFVITDGLAVIADR